VTHSPFKQRSLVLQATPQPPQLSPSWVISTQRSAQHSSHHCPVTQPTPSLPGPQFGTSQYHEESTQVPSQQMPTCPEGSAQSTCANPGSHVVVGTHPKPLTQTAPGSQVTPQPPQFEASSPMHVPPQQKP
jgi:hypothetical protein